MILPNFFLPKPVSKISEQDIKAIFNTKFLLVKKGKLLGKTVLRWAQPTKNGKLIYFTKKNSSNPSGFYTLYQTSCFKINLKVSSVVHKALELE